MNLRHRAAAGAAAIALFAASAHPASAATAAIFAFTNGGSGSVTFAVADMSQTAMPASGTPSYTLIAQTSSSTGSITLTAPTVRGASGEVISVTGFQARCTETSDAQNMFTTKGLVRLGSSPVSCATLAANVLGSVTFTISLYLDDTGDTYGFPADTYTSGTLSVIANLP